MLQAIPIADLFKAIPIAHAIEAIPIAGCRDSDREAIAIAERKSYKRLWSLKENRISYPNGRGGGQISNLMIT